MNPETNPEMNPGTSPETDPKMQPQPGGEQPDVEPTARLEPEAQQPVWQQQPWQQPGAYEPYETAEERGRNPLSVTYLVTGLVFLGIAGLWLAQETGAIEVEDLDLLGPLLLVVIGAAGLLAGLTRAVRRR